ncbi:MAG TPA: ATP-binding cassette domain-containing protein [bacterium]|nr:ATP-binding cassette domain-containing protein [bacterium]
MITARNLTFAYPGQPPILNNLNLSISVGTYLALMGPNGSGKTTLALLIKGLLKPIEGTITIDGLSSADESIRFEIMKRVGLVFQNPENTIVTTTVETELAFGLENLGVPQDEMKDRVNEALKRFNLDRYRHTNPTNLSGGEKQRLSLASVMIMKPSYLILDEPTALLDPPSRKALLDSIQDAVSDGTTVIHITQFSFEAKLSDHLIVLDESGVCMDGIPDEVLSETKEFRSGGMEFICSFGKDNSYSTPSDYTDTSTINANEKEIVESQDESASIALEKVSFIYNKNTPFEKSALENISLKFSRGSSTVLMGSSGSGKTTLLEIVAGITAPTNGKIFFNGSTVRAMAFQLPEDQMFGHTLGSYIEFGPLNTGVPESKIDDVISEALVAVGLEPVKYRNRDPHTLSGGEKRRAALAGVLAMKPDTLILDEPTAGLDRRGMDMVVSFLRKYLENGGTLLFSTHDFEVARCLADYAIVLDNGRVETNGKLFDVLGNSPWLSSLSG